MHLLYAPLDSRAAFGSVLSMVPARALSLIVQPAQRVQVKAGGNDTRGLAELLGKCHHKPTGNASGSANYPAGTDVFPFTVLYMPCVGTGEAISNASADCEADCEIAFHRYRARLYQAFKQRGGAGRDCKHREGSGSTAARGAEHKIALFGYFLTCKSQESNQV